MTRTTLATAVAALLLTACASSGGGQGAERASDAPSTSEAEEAITPTPVRLTRDEETDAPQLSPADAATVERIFALQAELVDILHANMGNADRAVAKLDACVDAHLGDIEAFNAMRAREGFDPRALERWVTGHMDHVASIVAKLEEVHAENPALLEDPRVVAALARIGGG